MQSFRMGAGPNHPYVSAVTGEGRFVFVSGQTPTRNGQPVEGSVTEQTAAVMDNLAAVLEAAGASLQQVVRCRVFLADLNDLKEFNTAYVAAFGSRLPARTTVGVALPGYKVEIDCIALLAPS